MFAKAKKELQDSESGISQLNCIQEKKWQAAQKLSRQIIRIPVFIITDNKKMERARKSGRKSCRKYDKKYQAGTLIAAEN
jgi:hypothetical protein